MTDDVVGLVEHFGGELELALGQEAIALVDQREGGSLGRPAGLRSAAETPSSTHRGAFA
jgi:hypothetical protein